MRAHEHSPVRRTGTPTVKFGGVAATGVAVKGSTWIVGKIPNSATGKCPTDVAVQYGTAVLTLAGGFCYASF